MSFSRSRSARLVVAVASISIPLAPAATVAADAANAAKKPVAPVETMTCPVDGESTFVDSWGAARSGGRRHQGVDLIADRGTPVVAAEAGHAEFKTTRAGGKSVWLVTSAGDRFFYAHLADWEGESRDVERGEVIGYIGSTGNAQGPHLHFEIHPDGSATNPFPLTDLACAGTADEDRIEASDAVADLGLSAR